MKMDACLGGGRTCKQGLNLSITFGGGGGGGGTGLLCLTKGRDYNTRLGYMCTAILDLVISTLTHARCTF